MNNQVNQIEIEIKSKANIIKELEVNLYYEKKHNYEIETKLLVEQEQSA
ncbi:45666_t:CDS:2 [Gigaspora margarita]|uniref:45666_t:CDS:1 n=1 Tax=Gigaspora margarita TaxID=4874 RepID=A0ABN7UD24_GIGMA|nr:45666_t:CDS:2 [Gigaspora margarita]